MAHYKELTVWQKSMELVVEVYRLVRKLPKEELYALSDQMRRAVVSIPSNIAEGQQRNSKNDFKHFLTIARGSNAEVETQLLICVRLNYFKEEEIRQAIDLCNEISRMLSAFILKL